MQGGPSALNKAKRVHLLCFGKSSSWLWLNSKATSAGAGAWWLVRAAHTADSGLLQQPWRRRRPKEGARRPA